MESKVWDNGKINHKIRESQTIKKLRKKENGHGRDSGFMNKIRE